MRPYNKYSMKNIKKERYGTDWAYKEGVFLTPLGKFIVRVRKGIKKTFTTLSQHNTKEEANFALDLFNKNKNYDETKNKE